MAKTAEDTSSNRGVLNVDFGATLLCDIEIMRRIIHDAVGLKRGVSRGDVVRLAVRRLYMALLVQDPAAVRKGTVDLDLYNRLWQEIQEEQICPEWLVPGQSMEQPKEPSKPRKEKRKCNPKKQQNVSGESENGSSAKE